MQRPLRGFELYSGLVAASRQASESLLHRVTAHRQRSVTYTDSIAVAHNHRIAASPRLRVLLAMDTFSRTHTLYWAMVDLRTAAGNLVADYKLPERVQADVLAIIDAQWETFASPMHAATYLLNPPYFADLPELARDKELRDGLRATIKKLTDGPEESAEVWRQFKQEYVAAQEVLARRSSRAHLATQSTRFTRSGTTTATRCQGCRRWPWRCWRRGRKPLSAVQRGNTPRNWVHSARVSRDRHDHLIPAHTSFYDI